MTTQILVRIESNTKEKFSRLSQREGKSTSEVIRELIGNYIQERDIGAYIDCLWSRTGHKLKMKGLRPENVLVSGGSNILIQALVVAAAVEGRVLTIKPSFSLYELEGALLGNRVTEVPLRAPDFSLPTEVLIQKLKVEKPSIVFIPNPNAPTGTLFPRKDLLAIIKAAKGKALVVIDEAYYPYSGTTLAGEIKKNSHLVVMRTFSKAFSLGGVRLGAILADASVITEVKKILLPFSVGVLSQIIGEMVLDDSYYMEKVVAEAVVEAS